MHEPKAAMAQGADAFIALPGSYHKSFQIVLKIIDDCLSYDMLMLLKMFFLYTEIYYFDVLDCCIACIIAITISFLYPLSFPYN